MRTHSKRGIEMANKFTHTAIKVGSDARTSKDFKVSIKLRETANYWIDEKGFKYKKTGYVGYGVGTWPMYRILAESITTNEYLNISQKKFLPHIQKLIDIAQNQATNSDIEEKASTTALHLANIVIEQLEKVEFAPSKIVESVEGGIAFCFVAGDKYADIECLNTGEILGVTTNRRDRPSVWEVQHNESEIARATERIREFIHEK